MIPVLTRVQETEQLIGYVREQPYCEEGWLLQQQDKLYKVTQRTKSRVFATLLEGVTLTANPCVHIQQEPSCVYCALPFSDALLGREQSDSVECPTCEGLMYMRRYLHCLFEDAPMDWMYVIEPLQANRCIQIL